MARENGLPAVTAVLLPPSEASFLCVAGLPLIRRIALGALRAGFDTVVALGGSHADRLSAVLQHDRRTAAIPVLPEDRLVGRLATDWVVLVPGDWLVTAEALRLVLEAGDDAAAIVRFAPPAQTATPGIVRCRRELLPQMGSVLRGEPVGVSAAGVPSPHSAEHLTTSPKPSPGGAVDFLRDGPSTGSGRAELFNEIGRCTARAEPFDSAQDMLVEVHPEQRRRASSASSSTASGRRGLEMYALPPEAADNRPHGSALHASPFEKGGRRGICANDPLPKSPLPPLFQRGASAASRESTASQGEGQGEGIEPRAERAVLALDAHLESATREAAVVPLEAEECLPVFDRATARAAEECLIARLRQSTADTDGPIARFDRAVSTRISRYLVRTPLRPNHITTIGTAMGLLAGWCFARGTYTGGLGGAVLFWCAVILDGCDGEVARLKFQESRWGGLYDVVTDNLVHAAIFFGLVAGSFRAGSGAAVTTFALILLGGFACALLATYMCLLRNPPVRHPQPRSRRGRIRLRLLRGFETLMNRDFAYLLLALALIGHLPWFVWGAALGTYAYAAGLVAVYLWPEGPS